jgi:hypothetical protein
MEFTNDIETMGTCGQGYIFDVTRAEIEAVFGKPAYDEAVEEFSGDGKVTVEWTLGFEDGTIATIYDWKRYELGTPAMDERIDWNIGGNSKRALEIVAEMMGTQPRTSHDILVKAGLA